MLLSKLKGIVYFSARLHQKCFENCLFKKRKNGDYHDLNRKEANICVKIDKEVKLNALNIYKTQWDGLDPYKIFPQAIAEHLLTHEYFFEAEL
jgi:hypothetical protein